MKTTSIGHYSRLKFLVENAANRLDHSYGELDVEDISREDLQRARDDIVQVWYNIEKAFKILDNAIGRSSK